MWVRWGEEATGAVGALVTKKIWGFSFVDYSLILNGGAYLD